MAAATSHQDKFMDESNSIDIEIEDVSRNPVELLDICRRMISEWQYLDSTVKQSKLINVERDVPLYRETKLRTTSGTEIILAEPEQERLRCTQLTIYDNYALHHLRDLRNLKNFRGDNLEIDFKEMETFYWLLRLRGRSAILPVAIIHMIPLLKEAGFTGWKLPSGDVIPFEALRTGNLEVSPSHLYIYRTIQKIGSYQHEDNVYPYHCKDYELGVGPVLDHCILVTTLTSGKMYVVDPTSIQFNMKGPNSTLIMYGQWNEYERLFPGNIIRKSFENWKEVFKQQLYSANNPMALITMLEERILGRIDRKCCDRCGEFDGTRNECPIPAMFYRPNINKLRSCSRCKKGQYCDDKCEGCDIINHNTECTLYATTESQEVNLFLVI